MVDGVRGAHGVSHGGEVAYVTLDMMNSAGVTPAQPVQVVPHACAAEAVEEHDVAAVAQQAIRQVGADEPEPARDERAHFASPFLQEGEATCSVSLSVPPLRLDTVRPRIKVREVGRHGRSHEVVGRLASPGDAASWK